jgi:hypothetical protein
MLRRILLALALLATAEAAKAKADPKECEVCIANLEAIDKLIDKDEKTSKQSIMEAITKQAARVNSSHFTIAPCAPAAYHSPGGRATPLLPPRRAPPGRPRRRRRAETHKVLACRTRITTLDGAGTAAISKMSSRTRR